MVSHRYRMKFKYLSVTYKTFCFLASFLSTILCSRHAQLLTLPQKCSALSKPSAFVCVVRPAWITLDPLSS